VEIVGALQEGFQRIPEAYGSNVRLTGKINDFSSGVREGAKVSANTPLGCFDFLMDIILGTLLGLRGCDNWPGD
jgi:hypothetical protein